MRKLVVTLAFSPLSLLFACAHPPTPAHADSAPPPAEPSRAAASTSPRETETSPQGTPHHFERPTHAFHDPAAWSLVFDAKERDEWQQPGAVIRELGLAKDATVADVGAGTGYFTMRLAEAVPEGKVLAVDVEQGLVDFVAQRVKKEGLSNVEVILAPQNDPKLPAGSVDVVLVVNTYHHIAERVAYFAKVKEALADAGRLVLVEWRMGQQPHGPPDRHKLPPEVITRELEQAGLMKCREWDELPYQYMLFYGTRCD